MLRVAVAAIVMTWTSAGSSEDGMPLISSMISTEMRELRAGTGSTRVSSRTTGEKALTETEVALAKVLAVKAGDTFVPESWRKVNNATGA